MSDNKEKKISKGERRRLRKLERQGVLKEFQFSIKELFMLEEALNHQPFILGSAGVYWYRGYDGRYVNCHTDSEKAEMHRLVKKVEAIAKGVRDEAMKEQQLLALAVQDNEKMAAIIADVLDKNSMAAPAPYMVR